MSKRYQKKSGTKKSKRQKQYRSDVDAPIASHGVMNNMVSNFRQLVSIEQKSGSHIGKYLWGALIVVLAIALAIWGLR